jgi:hypothetical protein
MIKHPYIQMVAKCVLGVKYALENDMVAYLFPEWRSAYNRYEQNHHNKTTNAKFTFDDAKRL